MQKVLASRSSVERPICLIEQSRMEAAQQNTAKQKCEAKDG